MTMTTTGYGDPLVPRTVLGRLVGCVTMLLGLVLLALPITVISENFAQEYQTVELAKLSRMEAEKRAKEEAEAESGPKPIRRLSFHGLFGSKKGKLQVPGLLGPSGPESLEPGNPESVSRASSGGPGASSGEPETRAVKADENMQSLGGDRPEKSSGGATSIEDLDASGKNQSFSTLGEDSTSKGASSAMAGAGISQRMGSQFCFSEIVCH